MPFSLSGADERRTLAWRTVYQDAVVRIDVTLPGVPDGGGGINFTTDLKSTSPLSLTPGSVIFQGQPVDFSGTEACSLAGTYTGTH